MNEAELVTLLVALYGALLSTALAIREFGKGKRAIKVHAEFESFTPLLDPNNTEHIAIRAVNIGYRAVEIVQGGVSYGDGSTTLVRDYSAIGSTPLPRKLEDGESVKFHVSFVDVKTKLLGNPRRRIRSAFVKDAEGKVYRTNISEKIKWLIKNPPTG